MKKNIALIYVTLQKLCTASGEKVHLAHTLKISFRSLLFLFAAGMFLFSCDDKIERSSEASMTSLTLTIENTDYKVTFTGKQGKITVPYATKLPTDAKVKAVQLSAKAKGIKVGDALKIPISGTVTLTVTAEDDKTKGVYTLTVEKASASKEASITALTLTVGDSDYKIDFTDKAYTLVLPAGSTLPTAVGVKEIALSAGSTGVANDDELTVSDNMVTITVTAEDGTTTQEYTVTFSVDDNNDDAITSLQFNVGGSDYDVTFENGQGSVTLPPGTPIPTTVSVSSVALSDGVTGLDVGNEFTVTNDAVTITVTAEDGATTQEYTVTFSVAANTDASITTLTLTAGTANYDVTFAGTQGGVTLPYGTTIPSTVSVASAALSAGATGVVTGDELTVSDNAVTITVTAEDGATTQEYTVTFSVAANTDASITALTLTVGSTDYEITFTGIQDTLLRLGPLGTPVPATVGVKQIALSDGATGIVTGDELTVTDNTVTITVTAEDGTTTNTYTIGLGFTTVGITSFTFEVTDNENSALDVADRQRIEGTIDQEAKTIIFDEQSAYVYLSNLKATFVVSEAGAEVQVGGVDQTSGITEQDFTLPVSYVVRKQGVIETTYTVTLTKSTMATIPDDQFRAKLQEFVPAAFTGDQLDIMHNDVVTYSGTWNISRQTPKITSVKGVEFFTALTELDLNINAVTSLDLSKNTALTNLQFVANGITSLDLSKNTALMILYCQNNGLRSLDVSANTALTNLNCSNNRISSLDVSASTALKELFCFNNRIPSLDLSTNTALTQLNCATNSLTFLDITGMRSVTGQGLYMGTGSVSNNSLLATLRVNTALQDNVQVVTIKTNRGAGLTVTTVNDAGTEVCADYTPAQGGGTCNDN